MRGLRDAVTPRATRILPVDSTAKKAAKTRHRRNYMKGEWRIIDTWTWMALLYSGLVPHAAGYMLWELALHRFSATRLGLMGAATPVLSTMCLLSLFAVTGKSDATLAQWGLLLTGAALILAAVLAVSINPASKGRRQG